MTNDIPTPDLSSLPLVMVRNSDRYPWYGPYKLLLKSKSTDRVAVIDPADCIRWWSDVRPYTPPTVRPMTHAEVFAAIREGEGAVVRTGRGQKQTAENYWCDSRNVEDWQICRNYTGTDSDVWEPMTKEEK